MNICMLDAVQYTSVQQRGDTWCLQDAAILGMNHQQIGGPYSHAQTLVQMAHGHACTGYPAVWAAGCHVHGACHVHPPPMHACALLCPPAPGQEVLAGSAGALVAAMHDDSSVDRRYQRPSNLHDTWGEVNLRCSSMEVRFCSCLPFSLLFRGYQCPQHMLHAVRYSIAYDPKTVCVCRKRC